MKVSITQKHGLIHRMRRMKQIPVSMVSQTLQSIQGGEPFVVTRRGKPVALTVAMHANNPSPKRSKAAFERLRQMAAQTPVCRSSSGITAQIRRDRDHDRL